MNSLSRTILTAVFLLCAVCPADTYIKSVHHTDAHSVMGKEVPAGNREVELWIGEARAQIRHNDTIVIYQHDNNAVIFVDMKSKTYREQNLGAVDDAMRKAAEESGMTQEQMAEMMQGMMQGMGAGLSATVTRTADKKRIGKWNCTKFTVNVTLPMGATSSRMWVTKDVAVAPGVIHKLSNSQMLALPGFDGLLKEFEKIDGLPVLTETTATIMGSSIVSRDKVVEVVRGKAPKGTYEVPGGFTKAQ